ncbi:hypothetical protein [Actinacidiphila glaucinigra]|uniref:hypothetical protein n=1 Tax=Actinacidiphila glaucinigra TaxID=235986 RepID=UPI00366CFC55
MRLESGTSWLELVHTGGEDWRVTADWCATLTADFDVCLTFEEVADFAARMLSRLSAPDGRAFSEQVTSGRNNPLRLTADPVEDGYAFCATLTPDGDDNVCLLRMEINPVDSAGLRDLFAALQASSAL